MTFAPEVTLTLASGWFVNAMTNPAVIFYMLLSMLFLVTILLLASFLSRAQAARQTAQVGQAGQKKSRVRRVVEIIRHDGGTATIEFALVFPILMFFTLLLAQTTLVMTGNLFVNYSAFMATRAAIVQIPRDLTEQGFESANQYANSSGSDSPKHIGILKAAAYALLPVAGPTSNSSSGNNPAADEISTDELSTGMETYYRNFGRTPPNWVDRQLNAKAQYAINNTKVTVLQPVPAGNSVEYRTLPEEGHTFGPKDAITVRVDHKLYLAFPYVGFIFSDGRTGQSSGAEASAMYTLVSASCTLTNEGIIDALPQVPSVRNPQSRRQ